MDKIGFIGYGSMGSIMLRALLDAKAIPQKKVILTNRTLEKLDDFRKKYPDVEIPRSVPELAARCSRIFICTSTGAVRSVLEELKRNLPRDAHVIIITGAIEVKCVENIFQGRISKIMPTQIAEVFEGITLVYHNSRALPEDKKFIRTVFGKIGKVMEVAEKQIEFGSEFTSCAPAFWAAMCRNFADTGARHGDLTPDEINEMIVQTLYGTAKLLKERRISFNDLIAKVATRGGISEEGVKILDRDLPRTYDDLFQVTLGKRAKIKQTIREQFGVK